MQHTNYLSEIKFVYPSFGKFSTDLMMNLTIKIKTMLIKELVKTASGFIFMDRKIRNSGSTSGCCCYFEFILWKYDINSYKCILVASA